MATSFTSLVASRRNSGQGITKSLSESFKEKLKEKFDPRRLINQRGILPALFPSLKTYQAKKVGGDLESSSEAYVSSANIVPQLKVIKVNTDTFTKNTMVLPAMRRDFSSLRSSIFKLVKLENGTPTDKADKYFMDSKAIEAAYKKKIEDDNRKNSPQKVDEDKKGFSFAQIALAVVAVGAAITYGFSKLSEDMQTSIKETLGNFGDLLYDGIVAMFDWSKLSFGEIKEIGSKVIEAFTSDDGLISSLFTPDVKKKIRELGGDAIAAVTGSGSAQASIPPITGGKIYESVDSKGKSGTIGEAKTSAEQYLGRPMSDSEFTALLNATKAESSQDTTSYAMVMASILNRARDGVVRHGPNKGKKYSSLTNPVVEAVSDPFQFEAVTGSEANNYKPSPNYTRVATSNELQMMAHGAINILPQVSRQQVDFTATSTAAYAGPGHNIGYRDKMLSRGGSVIAGTVFNTAPPASAVKPVVQNNPTPQPVPQVKRSATPIIESSENFVRDEAKPIVVRAQVNNTTVVANQSNPQTPRNNRESEDYFDMLFKTSIIT